MHKPRPPLTKKDSKAKASQSKSSLTDTQKETSKDSFEIKVNKVQSENGAPGKQSCLAEIVDLVAIINDDAAVQGSLFKSVVNAIEAKLSEFQERLDNRDNLQELNSHLQKLQFFQQSPQISPITLRREEAAEQALARNKSQQSLQNPSLMLNDNQSVCSLTKESPHRRSNSRQGTINQQNSNSQPLSQDQNRINILEKKQKQLEERYSKLIKETQDIYQTNVAKMEKAIRQFQDKFEQQSKFDFSKALTDISESQTVLISHLHDKTREINEINQQCTLMRDEFCNQVQEVKVSVEQSLAMHTENFTRIQAIQNAIQQFDSDFMVIMKFYKDILNDQYRLELLEQQQQRLLNVMNEVVN